MGLLDRIRSWFKPKPRRRRVLSDAALIWVPNDIVMQAVVLKTARTGQSVSIFRPNPQVKEGETEAEAKARFESELDAMAELLDVDRERPA